MPSVDINGTVVDFPDNLSEDELNKAVSSAADQISSNKSPKRSLMDYVTREPGPGPDIRKAAPSNLLKLLGVGSANAPGATSLVSGSIPGQNPADILRGAANLKRNPRQIVDAFKRMAQVQGGGNLTPREKVPATMGQVAGTGMEMAASPSLGTPDVEPSGPFSAGMIKPGTALPSSFQKAGQELSAAKTAARAGEDLKEAARLRGLLSKPTGVQKVAEEARTALEGGKDVSVTHLLAYREALGKMQAEGGTFADDYAKANDLVKDMIAKKAPNLASKMEQMYINFLARGNSKAKFPWFTFALNPSVGSLKALSTMPGIRNALGGLSGMSYRALPFLSAPASTAIDQSSQGNQ